LTLEDTFRTILPTSKWNYIDQCVHLYRTYQRDHPEKAFENVKLYSTVQETLGQLSKYYLAIVTSKPAGLADQILRLQGIRQFFSTIVGIDNVSNNKPAPDMIYLALSRLSSVSGAMMVGDTLADIQAGKKARLLTCAVEYGYTPKEILQESQPDFSISIFCDLLNILGEFA
jgi:pyrophosphatase PpaX